MIDVPDYSVKNLVEMSDASKHVKYVFYYWYKKYLNYEISDKALCHILNDFLNFCHDSGAAYDISDVVEKMLSDYFKLGDYARVFFLDCICNIKKCI